MLVTVNNPEGVAAAWREQKVVSSDGVFGHLEYDVAAVGVERVALRKQQGLCVVNRASGRKVFPGVLRVEADKIGHLLTLNIHHLKLLVLF